MRLKTRFLIIATLLLLLGAAVWAGRTLFFCSDTTSPSPSAAATPAGSPWFEDVTDRVGIDFVHDAGPTSDYFMPASIGSGAALFDFDGDGLLDVYLLQNGGPDSHAANRLYKQTPDGHFKDVSAGSGLDIAGWNMGVAIGDVNNDGRPDVLVTQYGGIKLFLNNGDGTLHRRHQEAGLEQFRLGHVGRLRRLRPRRLARSGGSQLCPLRSDCTFADGERRGRFLLSQDIPGDRRQPLSQSRSLRGKPGRVHFQDVTKASGLGDCPAPVWACSAPTSTATAGRTFLSPTTASPIVCGSTSTTARSPTRPCCAASPTTAWAKPRPAWA